MTVKELKEVLDKYNDDCEVVVLNDDRIGHDDAVLDFGVIKGFGNSQNADDVRYEYGRDDDDEDEDGDDEDDGMNYTVPCCVISVNAGG